MGTTLTYGKATIVCCEFVMMSMQIICLLKPCNINAWSILRLSLILSETNLQPSLVVVYEGYSITFWELRSALDLGRELGNLRMSIPGYAYRHTKNVYNIYLDRLTVRVFSRLRVNCTKNVKNPKTMQARFEHEPLLSTPKASSVITISTTSSFILSLPNMLYNLSHIYPLTITCRAS